MLVPGDWNLILKRLRPRLHSLRFLIALTMILSVSAVGVLKRTEGQATSTCNITYKINTQWNVGFQAEVTVTNTGPAINGWTVTWTFPGTQSIYELWNGVVTQSGANVTVRNASYNASIPTGGSVSFGFNANWSGSNPNPTSFALNGQTCGGSTPAIVTSVTSLNVNEGGTAQFGVRLSSAPTANVTLNVARVSGDADLTVTGGATLTFTPVNFGTQQMVTISAVEDVDQTNGTAVFRVSGTGLNSVDVNVSEVDNDNAPIAINTSVTTLNVNEGGNAQFGVRLATAPTSNVTVNVTRLSGDADLTVSGGATLTFTPANFGTFQNVTISAAEDADTTNGTAVFRASGTGLTNADVNVTEVDNDNAPIAINTSVATLNVNEGGSAQFGVRLATAPLSNVTVNVARLSGDTDLTVSGGATLTFTPANFATFQNVTISAAEDADTTNGTAVFRAAGTGLTSADVNVSEVDNDNAITIVTSVTTLNVPEGATAQFGVRLSAAPAANLVLNVTKISGDANLNVSSGATLTFTPANFATFQNVTISATDDADQANGSALFRVSGTGLTSVDVTAFEVDNDPIPIVTSVTTLSVNEGGSAQFGVRLSAAPPGNVTVNVARLSGDADLTVSGGGTLTFTPATFAAQQLVTISAAQDADQTNGTAIFRASGTGLVNADVNVGEIDNDLVPILTNLIRILPVVENSSAQFGVRLGAAPATNVTVNITRVSGDTNLTVTAGATLTFTPANFATLQNVTISAAEDADLTNGTAVFRAAATGLTSVDASVSEFDNDGAPVQERTFAVNLTGAAEVPPVVTSATGTASVLLSPDEGSALVNLSFSNLSSPQTGAHIHGPADPGTNAPGSILDLDQPLGQIANLLWVFTPVGGLTPQDIVAALKDGRLYANVHTANHPGGEIRGWFPGTTNTGGCTDTGGTGGPSDIARLLEQAAFGPTQAEIARVTQMGIPAWIDDQFNQPASNYLNLVQLQQGTFVSYPVKLRFFQNAMRNPDQLRQRVALALSQIVIAADIGNQDGTGDPTAMVQQYHDILTRNAFGNYRTLLREMTISPIMGTYLTLVNSKRSNPTTGSQPDENYIRELWQLFSVGTFRLNVNGTVQTDAQGRPLETYTIAEIQEGARALTGWVYAPRAGQPAGSFNPFAPMVTNEADHDTGSKTLLNGTVVPAGRTTTQDLDSVIDNVFNHPNVGPFISRQLIQHLVTSNPSPAYVARIATVFNNPSARGDLRAVVRAILLDPEARGNTKCEPTYGKLREPVLFLTHLFRGLECTGGMWGIAQLSRGMGQNVFSPPSVFNFYQPDFQIVAGGQTIFAPPAQILTTSTIIQRQNLLDTFLFGQIQPGGDPNPVGGDNTAVVLNFAPWDALAPNPAQLVDALNTRLMHGSMSAGMRQRVIDAVIAAGTDNRQRVRTAIYIIASSMQYQVQR